MYVYLYMIVINSGVVHSSSSASPKGLSKQHTPPPIGLRLSKTRWYVHYGTFKHVCTPVILKNLECPLQPV